MVCAQPAVAEGKITFAEKKQCFQHVFAGYYKATTHAKDSLSSALFSKGAGFPSSQRTPFLCSLAV